MLLSRSGPKPTKRKAAEELSSRNTLYQCHKCGMKFVLHQQLNIHKRYCDTISYTDRAIRSHTHGYSAIHNNVEMGDAYTNQLHNQRSMVDIVRELNGIVPVQWTNVEVVTHLKDNSSQLSRRIDIVDDPSQCRIESGMIIECDSQLCLRTEDE
eukprot:scaffold32133_cov31-Cyclotella_meneghiniana.AAC.3